MFLFTFLCFLCSLYVAIPLYGFSSFCLLYWRSPVLSYSPLHTCLVLVSFALPLCGYLHLPCLHFLVSSCVSVLLPVPAYPSWVLFLWFIAYVYIPVCSFCSLSVHHHFWVVSVIVWLLFLVPILDYSPALNCLTICTSTYVTLIDKFMWIIIQLCIWVFPLWSPAYNPWHTHLLSQTENSPFRSIKIRKIRKTSFSNCFLN